MLSQWECLFKNLGEWQGSFTRLSPRGEFLEDTPTIVSLESRNEGKTIHQIVRRLHPDRPPEDLILEYSSLNQSILFGQTGAFSQGYLYFSAFTTGFGAEFGLIDGERRARLVQQFDRSELHQLTLIRERLAGSNRPERPLLTVDQLIGEWRGQAQTTGRDWHTSPPFPTRLTIERRDENYLSQTLTFGEDRSISSSARIDGSRLLFENSPLPVQILLLPDGVSCNTPLKIVPGHRFVLEMGWLLSPVRRQRLVRSYNDQGEWLGITFVSEEKIRS